MPFLILDAGIKVTNYKSELESLRRKVIAIDSDVCDVQDVISSISKTTQTQQQKADSLTTKLLYDCPLLGLLFPQLGIISLTTRSFYKLTLNADMYEDGALHISPDCWQQYAQYSKEIE